MVNIQNTYFYYGTLSLSGLNSQFHLYQLYSEVFLKAENVIWLF